MPKEGRPSVSGTRKSKPYNMPTSPMKTRRMSRETAENMDTQDTADENTGPHTLNSEQRPPGQGQTQAPAWFDAAMGRALGGLEDRMSRKIDGIAARVDGNTKALTELQERQLAKEREMEKKIDRLRRETKKTIEESRTNGHTSMAANDSITAKNEESYNFCRRTLKVWPIKGNDLAPALKAFLKNKLKLSDSNIQRLGKVEVQRQKPRLGANKETAPDEVLVIFENREARDQVKAAARNLEGDKESGTRINVPPFLWDNFAALQSIGYYMKKANPDTRRAVKFDDGNFDLFLDVRVNGTWKRITPSQAKEAARKNPAISAGPERMTGEDIADFISGGKTPIVLE